LSRKIIERLIQCKGRTPLNTVDSLTYTASALLPAQTDEI